MVCVYCGGPTRVTNSRQQRRTNTTWRRRECRQCGGIFTTQEAVKLEGALLVINSQNSVEPFSREVLWLSLHDSLGHRKQPITDATGLTDTVMSRLWPLVSQATLTTAQIKQASTEVLKRFDKAAATHYQAYHPL